ncbi:4Fe-4S binding protein [Mastigocoleus testarum]|uniref:4Fe-4S ferredoxin-type domain-containing protein n=1 Tax=Mastigocoleus testarum BC008 TaxID=371196 RepID=A0A0V7ZIM8_9CYAN|nr:4Fe-4S binding protein [Mastigocoleus testarum]KST64457.1 hypothetical protein BC008_17665 [Mastigocoleus testarum BC008]KST67786.1 hypothetical protein BC008_44385 [Mastigocoleus testarum BC008]
MLSKASEKTMHAIRWVLVIGWTLLIVSLFYDPISQYLTEPSNLLSPLRDLQLSDDPPIKVFVQGKELIQNAYPIGARIFWGMVVPSAVMIVLVFGHETWRRICPLYFFSQIPRALGLKSKLDISQNKWLTRNHLYVQFAYLFVGLNFRILFINSTRWALASWFLLSIFSAILIVFLYGGRSWCHYVCPFGLVQTVFTGPAGLLGSDASSAPPRSITQSMCREIDKKTAKEKSACVACKSNCMDINAENSYWSDLKKPGRRFIQYGYLGLAIGYFVYYGLYAGNFDYYFSGAWTHEENQLGTLFDPGFYIFERAINIPKILAVPLTLGFFVIAVYLLCSKLEKVYRAHLRRRHPNISSEQVLHRSLSICTFIAFNAFFIYGGRPELLRFPSEVNLVFNGFVILVSTLWLAKTWGRSSEQYQRDTLIYSFRRQLKKLPIDISRFLKGRSLDDLTSNELFILTAVLPQFQRRDRLQVYKEILRETLTQGNITPQNTFEVLRELRQQLALNDDEHYSVLSNLTQEEPSTVYPVPSQQVTTVLRPKKLSDSPKKVQATPAKTEIRAKRRPPKNN